MTSLSSLATAAFDTARTTMKAMADAAVPPAGTDTAARTEVAGDAPAPKPASVTPATAVADSEAAATESKPAKGRRLGTNLDAYA